MKILCTLIIIVWGLGSLSAVPIWADAAGIVNSVADLASEGSTIWVANLQGNLQSVSIDATGQIAHLGYVDLANVQKLELDNQLLLAKTAQSWSLLDISNPLETELLYQNPISPDFVTAGITYPYVIEQLQGNLLNIFDISTPAQPTLVNSLVLPHDIQKMHCSEQRINISCADSLFFALQIVAETADIIMDSLRIPSMVRSMASNSQAVYLATADNHLLQINTVNPSQMTVQYFDSTAHSPLGIEIKADILAVLNSGGVIDYYTLGQSVVPILQASFMVWSANSFTLLDGYTITGSGVFLHCVNHTDLHDSTTDWSVETGSSAVDIVRTDGYYFVACGTAGIKIFSNIANAIPEWVSTITEVNASQIIVCDTLLYVADAGSGLKIFSISDIQNPLLLGIYNGSGGFWRIALENEVIYALRSSWGFKVIDVSNAANPVLLGGYNLSGVQNIIVSNLHAFVTSSGSGLYSFDISDSGNPIYLDNYELQGFAGGLCLYGQAAYVSNGWGISIIDITDPSNLWQANFLNPEDIGFAMDNAPVIQNNTILFWNNWANHLYVYDLSSPFNPEFVTTYAWNKRIKDVIWDQNKLISANEGLGFCQLELDNQNEEQTEATTSAVMSAYPNPFIDVCRFSFSNQDKSPTQLKIYNVKGQQVKSLPVKGSLATQLLTWDGNDGQGKPCSNGIYLAKITTARQSRTLKVVRLKS